MASLDVVSAYKELQLEKVALEESLRVLSSAQSSSESDLKSDTLETSENEVGATGEEAESKVARNVIIGLGSREFFRTYNTNGAKLVSRTYYC